MTELRRSIRCSNCGIDSNFSLDSSFILSELVVHAKCSSCSSSIQINFNIVESGSSSSPTSTETPLEEVEEPSINLEEELFAPDMLRSNSDDDISDIIEGT